MDIRVKPAASMTKALAAIGAIYSKYDHENAFEYSFADQEYARKFEDEQRIGRLAGFFTVLAILISCLGLLGLSSLWRSSGRGRLASARCLVLPWCISGGCLRGSLLCWWVFRCLLVDLSPIGS